MTNRQCAAMDAALRLVQSGQTQDAACRLAGVSPSALGNAVKRAVARGDMAAPVRGRRRRQPVKEFSVIRNPLLIPGFPLA